MAIMQRAVVQDMRVSVDHNHNYITIGESRCVWRLSL